MKSDRSVAIKQRNNKTFELRYTHRGQRVSIYGKTKAQCREIYKEIIKDIKETKLVRTTTFLNWYDKWVDLFRKDFVKANTLKNDNGIFAKYVLPYIANKSLKSIKTEHIQEIINNMKQFPRQATICYNLINKCFEQAKQMNMIAFNPCSAVIIKKHKGNKGKALTKQQQNILIEYLATNRPKCFNLILIYLTTGMRRNELLNIEYSDINKETNEIVVRGTKTINAKRTIQTTQEVINLIPCKPKPFEKWTCDKIDRDFAKICKELKFKDIKLHSLRHTFATNCIEKGVDVSVVQNWLGHSSITMTIDRYTHISEDFKQNESKKIDNEFLSKFV